VAVFDLLSRISKNEMNEDRYIKKKRGGRGENKVISQT
jgi:hypothetical protein